MHVIFLPGAGGDAGFWHALGALLPPDWQKTYLSWPGLGNQPHDPSVRGFDALVALAEREITGPVAVVAQSMGGIVGVQLALKYPDKINHLILVATSGGVDVSALGGADWRASYLSDFPTSQTWITTAMPDHSEDISRISCPTLLIWGGKDLVSPLAVGKYLATLFQRASLHVIEEGDHDLGSARADEIAALVLAHLD